MRTAAPFTPSRAAGKYSSWIHSRTRSAVARSPPSPSTARMRRFSWSADFVMMMYTLQSPADFYGGVVVGLDSEVHPSLGDSALPVDLVDESLLRVPADDEPV